MRKKILLELLANAFKAIDIFEQLLLMKSSAMSWQISSVIFIRLLRIHFHVSLRSS